jgi:CPA1 family monovalent cation:H+ antiporter
MENYAIILVVLGLMAFLYAVSERLKLSSPLLLVITGMAIGCIPSITSLQIHPEIVFLLFLPPLLFDAAFNLSFNDFKENLNTITGLAFGLVFLTTVGIAAVAHFTIPGMTWPLSFVVGATLAATDAVAAINITKNLGLTKTATTILEGESLINDASALVAYKFAVAAVAGATFVLWKASLSFLLLIGGGIAIGYIVYLLQTVILRTVRTHHLAVLSFILLSPFIAYLVAEEVQVSGVLAVVTLGFCIARLSTKHFPEKIKQESKTIWEMIAFLLNGLIFILIGSEFPVIIKSIDKTLWLPYIGYAFLITLVALIIRAMRVSIQRKKLLQASTDPRFQKGRNKISPNAVLTFQDGLIISWAGMRGIVSLAMALSLPILMDNGQTFPMRNEIIFITTAAVLLTIIGQGLLLPFIVKMGTRA